jgi:hypothetical protein
MVSFKKVILPATLVLALVVLGIRLDAGIWDPWEMNRAHVARQLTGQAKVLVVGQGKSLQQSLASEYGEEAYFTGLDVPPEGPRPKSAAKANRPSRTNRILTKAGEQLRQQVFHCVLMEAALLVEAPEKGIEFVELVKGESPGARHFILAESEAECTEAVATLELAMVQASAAILETGYDLLPADFNSEQLAQERAGAYPFVLNVGCVTEGSEELSELVAGLDLLKWTRVQFKGSSKPPTKKKKDASVTTDTWSVPPLDYWLTGLSYKAFGFSETTSRLPTIIFALGTLLLFAFGLTRLFDRNVAVLACLVLLSIPLFFGQAKNMSGEMSYTFFLTLGILAFAFLVKDGFGAARIGGLLAAATGLFLAKGLFGMGLLVLLLVLYIVLARDWRLKDLLLPTGILALLFGLLVLLVQVPSEWTFFEHFKFMNKAFQGGLTEERRTFDFFVRHVSFALMPWTLLLPFAIARLIPLEDNVQWTPRRRLELLTFLWFTVPFVLQSAVLPGFLHTVFPGVTAVALAMVLLWQAEGKRPASRFYAVVALGIAAVILANLFKSPQHLLSYLALDPEIGLTDGNPFPPDFATPTLLKVFLGLATLTIAAYFGRGGTILKQTVGFFRRPLPFWAALWTLVTLFVVRLVAGLASRFQTALTDRNAGKLPPQVVEFYQELFGLRIESILLYIGLTGAVAFWLLFFTPLGPWLGRKLRFLAPVGRLLVRGQSLVARDYVGLAAALLLAAVALLDILVTFDFPVGTFEAVLGSPSFLVGLLLPVASLGAAVVFIAYPNSGGRPVELVSFLRFLGANVVVALLVLTSAFFRQTDLGAPDIWVLSVLSFLFLALYVSKRLLDRPGALHLAAWGLLLSLGISLFIPMALRWPGVEAIVYPKSQVRYLPYLLLESRLTWLPMVLALFFVATYLFPQTAQLVRSFGFMDRLLKRLGGWNPGRWPEQLERPQVAGVVVLLLALGAGTLYAVQLLPGFSKEVSQKHILELYYAAEDRSDLGGDIFKYQGRAGSDAEDKNFYTARIPALQSQADLTAVLLGQTDKVVKVARSSSHPGPAEVLVQGFSPENDADGDGLRDYPAEAGIASDIGNRRLTDESKTWEPGQWKGSTLYDARGKPFDIQGNDATSLELKLTPPAAGRADARRYIIDSPEAVDHTGSAMEISRNYVILSQEAFSSVNFSFRSKSKGMHIPVLDGSNVNFLLAASYLTEGEKNHNRFANATIARERFNALEAWTKAEPGVDFLTFELDEDLAQHGRIRSGYINFNDQIRFVGYQMKSTSVARGDKLSLRLLFDCTGKLSTSWKIFIHMDSTGASNRIHGDHWPLNMTNDPEDKKCAGCWRTNHWMKGDVILDDFRTEVPMGSPSGIYNIYMGLYTPGSDKRLKVKDYDKKKIRHDGKDRVFIGTFEVH